MHIPEARAPTVSVVVPTRNRADHAAACAASILAIDGFAELIVVDQSDDRVTEETLSKITDPRFRYVRTKTRGVTSGRNLGMALTKSDIIAFTDDDCRVKSSWVARIVDILANDSTVAVVCGRVHVPHDLRQLGWAEAFEPTIREWQGRYPPMGQWGLTANLSVRRAILDRIGPFDPLLGAGAPLRSGGEPDFLFRVLQAGFKVVNAEEVIVDHLGIRQLGAEVKDLIVGYGIGTAAAFMKHVRLGDSAAVLVYLCFLFKTVFQVLGKVMRCKRPTGGNFLKAFLLGTFASFRFRVDRQHRQYVGESSIAA